MPYFIIFPLQTNYVKCRHKCAVQWCVNFATWIPECGMGIRLVREQCWIRVGSIQSKRRWQHRPDVFFWPVRLEPSWWQVISAMSGGRWQCRRSCSETQIRGTKYNSQSWQQTKTGCSFFFFFFLWKFKINILQNNIQLFVHPTQKTKN